MRQLLAVFFLLCCLPAWSQTGLDTTKWTAGNGVWINLPNGDGICNLPANVAAGSGLLTLTADWVPGTNCAGGLNYGPQTQRVTGGSIWAKSFSFITGAIEAKIMMPGNGIHSTFWLMGAGCQSIMYQYSTWCNGTWPSPNAEYDICEYLPAAGNPFQQSYHAAVGSFTNNLTGLSNPSTNWHTCRIEFSSFAVTFLVDGVVTYTQTTNLPSSSLAWYPIFSEEVEDSLGGTPVSGDFPTTFQVQYVRVWSTTTGSGTSDPNLIFDDEFTGVVGINSALAGKAGLAGGAVLQ